jgi:serine/threonine protein kinase
MELIEGKSLAEIIASGKPPDIEQTLAIFILICNGLEAIHNAGLLHRDLKPGNIKLSENGSVKVLDFGCAKWILQEQNLLTRTDEAVGTPAYMSPEQCLGKPVDARSDIYSLGCVMYEVLTAHRPFASDNLLECMRMHLKSMPPEFKAVQSGWQIPKGLESVVFKAMAKDPDDRFASAAELRKALTSSLTNFSRGAQILEPWHRLGTKRRKQIILSIISFVLLSTICAAYLWQSSKTRSISFPDGHEVGTLFIIGKDTNGKDSGRSKIGTAQGIVQVPINSYVQLAEVPESDAEKLSFLEKLGENDIQRLDLSGTALKSEAINNINRLTKLDSLSLNSTTIADEALEQLRLSELTGLDLTGTAASDRSMISIVKNCPKLHWMQLRGNSRVTNEGVAILTKLPAIKALLLQNVAQVTDACLKTVGKSGTIDMMVLRADNITDEGLANLSSAINLASIDLSSTHITNIGVKNLSKLSRLRVVNLSDTKIDDNCIPTLASMTGVRSLNVSSTAISADGLRRLRAALPDCQIRANE